MPACVEEALNEVGFSPIRLQHFSRIDLVDFEVTLFPSGHDTVVWENRVTSFLVRHRGAQNLSAFVAVDALVSREYIDEVASRRLPDPHLVIVSNNSQIVPYGGFGAQTNLLPVADSEANRFAGLSVMSGILLDYLSDFPAIRNVALCGNGFVNMKKPYGPFLFSNNKELAQITNTLSVDQRIHGPDPGDILSLTEDGSISCSTCSFISLDSDLNASLYRKRDHFLKNPIPQNITPLLTSGAPVDSMLAVVTGELNRLAPALLVSATGKRLLEQNEYLSGPVGAGRAVIRLLHDCSEYHIVFDVSTCSFKPGDMTAEYAMRHFPMGVEVFLSDFYGVATGEIQIWDLAGTSMRSWYIGSKYENLIAFLFSAFGEQARPDLALKVYRAAIERLNLNETVRH